MGKSKDGNVTCFMYTQMRIVATRPKSPQEPKGQWSEEPLHGGLSVSRLGEPVVAGIGELGEAALSACSSISIAPPREGSRRAIMNGIATLRRAVTSMPLALVARQGVLISLWPPSKHSWAPPPFWNRQTTMQRLPTVGSTSEIRWLSLAKAVATGCGLMRPASCALINRNISRNKSRPSFVSWEVRRPCRRSRNAASSAPRPPA